MQLPYSTIQCLVCIFVMVIISPSLPPTPVLSLTFQLLLLTLWPVSGLGAIEEVLRFEPDRNGMVEGEGGREEEGGWGRSREKGGRKERGKECGREGR